MPHVAITLRANLLAAVMHTQTRRRIEIWHDPNATYARVSRWYRRFVIEGRWHTHSTMRQDRALLWLCDAIAPHSGEFIVSAGGKRIAVPNGCADPSIAVDACHALVDAIMDYRPWSAWPKQVEA